MINNILTSQLFLKLLLFIKAILITSNPLIRYPIHEAIKKNNLPALIKEIDKIKNLNDFAYLNKDLKLPVDIAIQNNNHQILEWFIINNKLDKNIPYYGLDYLLKGLECFINMNDYKIVKLLQLNEITYNHKSINEFFPSAQAIQDAHNEIIDYKKAVRKGVLSALSDAINNRRSEFDKWQWLEIALKNNHKQQILHAIGHNYLNPLEVVEGLIFYKNLPCHLVLNFLLALNENEIKMLKKLAQQEGNKKIVDKINEDQSHKLMNNFNDFDIKFILNKSKTFSL